jgi:hypothetical protein
MKQGYQTSEYNRPQSGHNADCNRQQAEYERAD